MKSQILVTLRPVIVRRGGEVNSDFWKIFQGLISPKFKDLLTQRLGHQVITSDNRAGRKFLSHKV